MRRFLFVLMMCVAMVASAQSWSKDLEKKAKKGDVIAQVAVANAYASGDGVKIDLNKAAKWYYEAAKQGHMEARIKLYSFYSKELEKLAKEGDVQAQFEVGEDYFKGDRDLEPNAAKAASWYYMATQRGHAQAKERLYSFYSEELEGLAEKGHMEAQLAVGNHYLYANKVKKNTAEAAKWYNRAAFQGSEKAKQQLFSFYNDELKAHAENGYADAQYAMGQCYQYAYEVSHSYSDAMKWYLKAANQGHEMANEALYGFYNKELLRRAKLGEAKAQYQLGLCYLNGIGVEKNRATAESWMKKGFVDKAVRISCLEKLVKLQLNEMENCRVDFHNGSLLGIYDGKDVVNAQLELTSEKGSKYAFEGVVHVGNVEILSESYQSNNSNGEFKYSQIFTLKKGGVFTAKGSEGFEYKLIDDMQLSVLTSRDYSYFLGDITMSAIKSCNKELKYPLTITYNVSNTYSRCDAVGNIVLPENLRTQVTITEERVFMTPGKKDLTNDKIYSLKGRKCKFQDGSLMTVTQLDDNAAKEVLFVNDAKNIEIKWDAIMSNGQYSRRYDDTTVVYVGEGELKFANGEMYKGTYRRLSLNDMLQLVDMGKEDIAIGLFVIDNSNGVYYYADGRTEELINGKLEHVIIEESRQARLEEERKAYAEMEKERGFLYAKYNKEHVDMLFNSILCDGMDSDMINEFLNAKPHLADFSYGRQGNIVFLFITFHNGATYCYQVDGKGLTYNVEIE